MQLSLDIKAGQSLIFTRELRDGEDVRNRMFAIVHVEQTNSNKIVFKNREHTIELPAHGNIYIEDVNLYVIYVGEDKAKIAAYSKKQFELEAKERQAA